MATSRRGAKKNYSMQDVANLAGVSRTTVSFVINNVVEGNIPPETQQRVWDAVAQLGYRPNAVARNLRSQRTQTLGFISDDIATSPFAGQMIQGAQDCALENDKLLLLINAGYSASLQSKAAVALVERQVEGILYASMYHRQIELPEPAREVPVVLLDCFSSDGFLSSVVPDEVRGGFDAIEHLIANGHKRIGMLNNVDDIPAASGRLEGYKKALQTHLIPFDSALVVAGASDPGGGYECAMNLLQQSDRPTALFCFNDRMALGAYQAAADRNLAIPRDLSIVGFDNQETLAPWLRPALTTMQLPHYEMGRFAVEELLRQISSPDISSTHSVHRRVYCPLVVRESVSS